MSSTEDKVEAPAEAPAETSIEIGGVKFTGGKVFAIATALSAAIGTLYGGFELYKDYMDMKQKIQEYTAPDLSGINERISVLEERMASAERITKANSEALNYITGSVSESITSTRQTVDALETRSRASDRDMLQSIQMVLNRLREQDVQQEQRIKQLERQMDEKIQRTLANPLAGRGE